MNTVDLSDCLFVFVLRDSEAAVDDYSKVYTEVYGSHCVGYYNF